MTDTGEKRAVLFPGQGSQEMNMGRDAAEADSEAMELWKVAEKISGADLRGIYWDGDEKEMAETRWLQPALTVVNLSLWKAAGTAAQGDFYAGHSLGEYSALCAASVLSARDTLELVSLRGRLMSEAADGTMAAILKLDEQRVAELVKEAADETGQTLIIANYNSPIQFVVSGGEEAVAAASAKAKELKGRGVALPVSGAFHTPLMEEAAGEFASMAGKKHWSDAKAPVVLNVTGKPEKSGDAISAAMLRQMTSSVLWIQSMAALWDEGVRLFVEPGPKGVLTRLLSANFKGREEPWEAVSLPDLETARGFGG